MKETIKRNNAAVEEDADIPHMDGLIDAVSTDQRKLTEEFILPYKDFIVEDFKELRERADRELKKTKKAKENIRDGKKYPIGLCRNIRDEVYEMMLGELHNRHMQGLKSLKTFVRKGGAISKFWAIDSDKYFQNAIQIGSAVIDVANDTVDKSKEPIIFYDDVLDAPFEAISDFVQFANVVEQYWGRKVYPNIYLPELALVAPMMVLAPSSDENYVVLELETQGMWHLLFLNMYAHNKGRLHQKAYDFIFNSKYSDRRLPKVVVDKLFNRFRHDAQKNQSFRFSASEDEVSERFEQSRIVANKGDTETSYAQFEQIRKEMIEMYKAANKLSRTTLVAVQKSQIPNVEMPEIKH